MQTFLLNEHGDLDFNGTNNLKMVEGKDEEVQQLRIVLSTNKGEFFLDLFHGLDYKPLQSKYNQNRVRVAVTKAIRQVPTIEEIERLDINFDNANRKLTINFRVRTGNGIIEGQEVI